MIKSAFRVVGAVCLCICVYIYSALPVLAMDVSVNSDMSMVSFTVSLDNPDHMQQFAKSTFLPDRFDDLGLSHYNTLDNDYNSVNCDMYPLSSCPAGGRCETCPFNVKQHRVIACRDPYILSNGTCTCPAKVTLDYANDRCTKYCGSTCIAKSCTPTSNQSGCTNGTYNCSNGCGANTRKCCVACTDKVTSKPANSSYTDSSCYDGTTKRIHTGWKCNSGYHQKDSSCEKDCITNNCSGYSLGSCPENANCSSCTITATNCTTSGTKYKFNSCNSGYKLSGSNCVLKTCEDDGLYSATACYISGGVNYGPLSYWTKANMGL